MRYSLLNFVACPRCGTELTCLTLRETAAVISPVGFAESTRVSPEGAVVGPLPHVKATAPIASVLAKYASEPAPPDRNYQVEVEEGLLVCVSCGAWFPIFANIPEILPDHLRDWEKEGAWLRERLPLMPADVADTLARFRPANASDAGAHHKLAEISLPSKITDPAFFGPGYVSPFNLWTPEHTWHLIRNFAVAEPLLEVPRGGVVLDAGSGYSWTTEWMLRSGYEPIGMDICRAYLEIAIARIGVNRPHLVVGETEHLPMRATSVDAVIAFEAFHHIPDRKRAMVEFNRVLKARCPVVLVEPGGAHEHAAVSVEVMDKYGTLEKGMELEDVMKYAEGTGLGECRQQEIQRREIRMHGDRRQPLDQMVPVVANNIYTLRKN